MHKSYKTIIARMVNDAKVKSYLTKLLGKDENYNSSVQL